jgi:hypothetical protein
MRKYIVDNLENQTISGNIRLDGTLRVSDGTYSIGTYKALLTQTATSSSTNFDSNFLIIGETYTITNYVPGDDFSNIANVITGLINETGCEFIATGEIPLNWSNETEITSSGNLVVDVIENNLGFDIIWQQFFDFGPGVYVGLKSNTGPLYNSFPRRKVSIKTQETVSFFESPELINIYSEPSGLGVKDEAIVVVVYNWDTLETESSKLYYNSIEISFKQDLDTTPIVATGSVLNEYPIYSASVGIFSNGYYIETIYANNQSNSNNLSELITLLNEDIYTSYLGVFSDDEAGGIQLTIPTNIKNQFSESGTLTFEVFID